MDWIYIDNYSELSDVDFIHCDTRDFHILCTNGETRLDIRRELYENFGKGQCYLAKINREDIIPLLKSLETKSGGKGKWRYLKLNFYDFWLKYIRFVKDCDDKYLIYYNSGGKNKLLKKIRLENGNVDEEILGFH